MAVSAAGGWRSCRARSCMRSIELPIVTTSARAKAALEAANDAGEVQRRR